MTIHGSSWVPTEETVKMKFTKRVLEAIEATDKRQHFSDNEFTGLALRVSEKGRKSFYYTYRVGHGSVFEKKWVMLGVFPVMTVEQARQKAKELAANVQNGIDPALAAKAEKEAVRMDAALALFMADHVAKLKPETRKQYTALHDKHFLSKLGRLRVKDISHSDIAKLHRELKETPYLANRCLAVLSKFFSWCELNDHRDRNSNPANGVTKYKEYKPTYVSVWWEVRKEKQTIEVSYVGTHENAPY